jgi:hypothetical protein
MARRKGGPRIGEGGASKPIADERRRKPDIAGKVGEKDAEPSPATRERGERASADPAPAIDLEGAHQRAS